MDTSENTEMELGGILYDIVLLIYIKFENMQIKIMYFFHGWIPYENSVITFMEIIIKLWWPLEREKNEKSFVEKIPILLK